MRDLLHALPPLTLRVVLLAITLYGAACAAPPHRTTAEADPAAGRGNVTTGTPLVDFDLSGVVGHLQKGDTPDQRRFSCIDQPGGYKVGGPLQVKRTETEEERQTPKSVAPSPPIAASDDASVASASASSSIQLRDWMSVSRVVQRADLEMNQLAPMIPDASLGAHG